MSDWSLTRKLEYELGLSAEMCDRIVEIVGQSRDFVSRETHSEEIVKWDQELANAESTIEELRDIMRQARDILG